MRPDPFEQLIAFLTKPEWPTPVFWVLMVASVAIAARAWQVLPEQREPRSIAIWILRFLTGMMWWQGTLWKIPPNYDGLLYWMKQIVDHAPIPLQSLLVRDVVIPNIAVFGPAVYLVELAIAVSMILGVLTRLGALLGVMMTANLWFGLYSAPGEWPWTYGFLLIIMSLFFVDPPGRCLGLDAFWRTPQGRLV